MKKYITIGREAGYIIDEFKTLKEAEEAIESYEIEDKKLGIYEKNFYGIKEIESEIRKNAALKRWKGHKKVEYTTIRIKEIIKNQINKMPGKSISDKIEKLINK